jgi:hypothetical protein
MAHPAGRADGVGLPVRQVAEDEVGDCAEADGEKGATPSSTPLMPSEDWLARPPYREPDILVCGPGEVGLAACGFNDEGGQVGCRRRL